MAIDLDRTAPTHEAPAPEARSLPGRWRSEHARGLLLIGVFKLAKALLSIALGIGALHLLHRDVSEVALRVTDALRIDPENHMVFVVVQKAGLIGSKQLKHFSIATFCYAGLCLIEGTGLMLQKRWAEYFTVTLTILALPWELFELVRRFTWVRIAVLVVNILVLVYLVWLLGRKRREGSEGAAAEQAIGQS